MLLMPIIKNHLLRIIEDIDGGNSNLTEQEALDVVQTISNLSRKDEGLSKYQACQQLHVSRATFDNLVKEGKIPKGKHIQGFKELRWYKKDLIKV